MTTPKRPRLRAAAGVRADAPPWYRIGPVLSLATPETAEGAAPSGTTSTSADVYLYDTIGGWLGLTADDFVRDVASLDVDQIVLHLNSPGGDALEGVTIANVLRAHRARIVVRVDGLAASAASVVAMAGDEVVMGIGSQMMVHDPWGICLGNAAELEAFVRRLHATGDSLASTLAAKAGGTTADWRTIMQAETWYTAEEAVAAGLADRVAAADETATAEGEQIVPGGNDDWFWSMWDSLRDADRFDLAAFTYPGRSAAPEPAMPGRTAPAASAAGTRTEHERSRPVAFSDVQLNEMRQRLGLAADADEATIVAALGEALDEQTAPAPAARAALPEGVVTIEQTALDQLQADARAGRDALTRQERDDRDRLVSAAVADGRVAPARRDAWVAMLAADPGATDVLANLPKGLIPVDEPQGHDRNDDTQADLVDQIWGDTTEKGA